MQTVLGSVLPRRAEVVRREALDDTRVVLVNGARQLWIVPPDIEQRVEAALREMLSTP